MAKFPRQLADAVHSRWHNLIAGEYTAPACPPKHLLRKILETCHLAASSPEEARYPQFNVVVTESNQLNALDSPVMTYRFDRSRPMSVSEIRRLAPASNVRKSAIWIEWDESSCQIAGLCDLGTSWHRSRLGLSYSFQVPSALIIQIDRPGKIKVYQGVFSVASLLDGDLVISRLDLHLFLHKPTGSGFHKLLTKFTVPEYEHPRDFENFWFTAHWNVFAAIANSVSLSGHGGMLIIADDLPADLDTVLRIKYPCHSDSLQSSFIDFINSRNRTADFWTRMEEGDEEDVRSEPGLPEAELHLLGASEKLVEATRFVSHLSGCDGAIVITDDLQLIGFGAEIRAEMQPKIRVHELTGGFGSSHRVCDVEQFGMRHRSAIKLASMLADVCILVVSQDGPISAVWQENGKVIVKKNVTLSNMNMPLS